MSFERKLLCFCVFCFVVHKLPQFIENNPLSVFNDRDSVRGRALLGQKEKPQRRLIWVNWLHKNVNEDTGSGLSELTAMKEPPPPPPAAADPIATVAMSNTPQQTTDNVVAAVAVAPTFDIHSDENEENAFKSFVENDAKSSFTWWNQEAISWLAKETRVAKDDFAFGILTSTKTDYRLNMAKYWWIEEMDGCVLYIDSEINKAMAAKLRLPLGLIPCNFPSELTTQVDVDFLLKKSPQRARVALASLVLQKQFPHASWYVIGDDDTLFSPLALVQWLGNYDESDKWYMMRLSVMPFLFKIFIYPSISLFLFSKCVHICNNQTITFF
jgi:hypothetical protein